MNSVAKLMNRFAEQGIKLWLSGDKLKYQAAKDVLTDEVIAELKVNKEAIINFLSQHRLAFHADRSHAQPLSFAQERLWFLDQYEEGNSAAYNSPLIIKLQGNLNVVALQQALTHMIAKHEILRTRFTECSGQPLQFVEPAFSVEITNKQVNQTNLQETINEIISRPFSLAQFPLIHFDLLELSKEEHVFIINQHHISTDGWSIKLFLSELANFYRNIIDGIPLQLNSTAPQYLDYALWQRQVLQKDPEYQLQVDYWVNQLQDVSNLDLHFDRKRPAKQTYAGGRLSFMLSNTMAADLKLLASKEKVSLFMLLLAAFNVLLQRYSGSGDIAVGTPVANRHRAEFEETLGLFINTLVIRNQFDNKQLFSEFLQQVKQQCLDAYSNQDVPFEKIVEQLKLPRDLSRNPLFQVMFVLRNKGEVILPDFTGLEVSSIDAQLTDSKFDLSLYISETDEGLDCEFEYNSDLFDHSTIERMQQHWQCLLTGIIVQSDKNILQYSVIDKTERQQLLVEYNETQTPYLNNKTINELFAEQAQKTPNKIATVFEGESLTYQQLYDRTKQLAHAIRQLCCIDNKEFQPETLIAVYGDRSLIFFSTMLSVFKAGAAYLPLDPGYPARRIEQVLQQSQTKFILSTAKQANRLREQLATLPEDLQAVKVLVIEELLEQYTDTTELENIITPDSLAYVMFTSGSTGLPKGAMVEHKGMINHLYAKLNDVQATGDDVFIHNSSQCFDISVFLFISELVLGGKVVVVSEEVAYDPVQLIKWIDKEDVTLLEVVPSMIRILIDAANEREDLRLPLNKLRWLISTGDALLPELCEQWFKLFPDIPILNTYGPTECSDDVMHFAVYETPENKDSIVPIGYPIQNMKMYVLDEAMQPVPIGVQGELYIGGLGVGLGYLNDEQRTKVAFMENPFSNEYDQRLYKTGDLVKRLQDGSIEFIGRLNSQVKIRGFRVGLGGIESVLRQHSLIKECVLHVVDHAQEKHIAAYCVIESNLIPDDEVTSILREYLKAELPEYMLPSFFVMLDSLPLNNNGKVDRKRLPKPQAGNTSNTNSFKQAETSTQQQLVAIWEELLTVSPISIYDNFFQMGGNSLLSVRLMAQIREKFTIELALRIIFEKPTIFELAEYIDEHQSQFGVIKIKPASRKQTLPLSFAQQRLWFLEQYEEDELASYSMPMAIRLTGKLDFIALERSINMLFTRHEALRTLFVNNDGIAEQVIINDMPFTLNVEKINESQLQERLMNEAHYRFNLATAPLCRVCLLQINDSDFILVINHHHIISDGLSLRLFVEELAEIYQSFVSGSQSNLPALSIQYADYALWQKQHFASQALADELAFWKHQLEGIEPLNLITDFQRPAVKTYAGNHYHFTMPKALLKKGKQLNTQTETTLFMLLLAVLNILLNKHTQQDDIVIGTAVANRNNTQLENLIGLFVNTLALRTKLDETMSFTKLLQQVKQSCFAAYSHQELPFEELVDLLEIKRDVSRDPIFQVMLVLQNKAETDLPNFPNLKTELIDLETHTSKFDLSFNFIEVGDELRGIIEYNTDLFKAKSIAQFAEQFTQLFESVLENPQYSITDYSLLSSDDISLINKWNATEVEFPKEKTIQQLFVEQAKMTPKATAICFESESLSYAELDQRSNQLASYLVANQFITDNKIVAVSLPRSLELMVVLLGIIKAGGAYLPIDMDLPNERIQFILKDSGSKLVITEKAQTQRFKKPKNLLFIEELASYSSSANLPLVTADDLMYVIYTSGSTGQPKGVLLGQRGIVNRLYWMQQQYPLTANDVVLQKTPYSFDVSVWELFWPLISGAKLCFAKPELHKDPEYLQNIIQQQTVTTMHFVPSMLKLFLNELSTNNVKELHSLRQIFCSGEALPMSLVKECKTYLSHVNLHNLYGPTEASIDVSYWDCSKPATTTVAPIGKPIANTKLYVLDKSLRQVSIGMIGELYIAGEGVAKAYLNRDDLNSKHFLDSPFIDASQNAYRRMYKTGDLARWNHQGELEYLGRIDHQVKIRGLRIELGEIEAALLQHQAIKEAIVAVKGEGVEKQLCGYIVKNDNFTLSIDELRNFLLKHLPDYMVPSYFAEIAAIPMSANGKADRKQLPLLAGKQLVLGNEYVAPRTETEEALASLWQQILNIKKVGVHDDFFSLGGDSIMSIQLIAKARKLGFNITPKQLFVQPTIASLAKLIDRQTESTATLVNKTVYEDGCYPLSPLKEGLLFHMLFSPNSDLYSTQFNWHYKKSINSSALKQAWQQLIQRHEILRSRFALRSDGSPMQQVEKTVPLPWHEEDWSNLSASEQATKLENYLQDDREQSFDINKACLMRLHLVKLANDNYIFIWTYHHILLDGWSLPILLQELQSLYDAIAEDKAVTLESPADYRNYLSWLAQQDKTDAVNFWSGQLKDIKRPTNLGMNHRPLGSHGPVEHLAEVNDYYSYESTKDYKKLAQQYKLSFNALLQAAWALVLSLYSGEQKVVFGSTVSGRSGEVEGIERMVGLFINSLPMRIDINPQQSVLEYLQNMHRTIQEANLYSYCSLSTIQKHSEIPQGMPLFHSLFVFENYPLTDAMLDESKSLTASSVNGFGRTHFPLMLTVDPGEKLHIQYAYDANCFTDKAISQLAIDIHSALDWISSHLTSSLAEVNFVPASVLQSMVRSAVEPIENKVDEIVSSYNMPNTDSEQRLLSQLQSVLSLNRISITTPFFELGGDSLLAVRYKFKIDKEFGLDLPLSTIFNYPTIELLAKQIDSMTADFNEVDEDQYFVEDF